jgi:hypothetical protein
MPSRRTATAVPGDSARGPRHPLLKQHRDGAPRLPVARRRSGVTKSSHLIGEFASMYIRW